MNIRTIKFLLALAIVLVTLLMLMFSCQQIAGVREMNANWAP